jgi:uncharacterized protein YndB with AHSA1/START domain
VIPASVQQRTGITIQLRRRFPLPREKVFRAWTDADALKRWWCPQGWVPAEIEVDARVGGAYRIGMRRPELGVPIYVYGHFIEVQPPERLVYTWQWENAFEQMPQTRVTVQFIESWATTEIVLTHENLPEIWVCLRHRTGWIAAWERIERSLWSAKNPSNR